MSAKLCVLMSGGLDSGLVLDQSLAQGERVFPLYLRCGFRWEAAEQYWLSRLLQRMRCRRLEPLQIIDVPLHSVYGKHWSLAGQKVPGSKTADDSVYLPGRNVLLLSVAAVVCAQRRISTIAIGILQGNPFADATPRFFNQLASCLTQALRHPLRILTPVIYLRKAHLIRYASNLSLELTFSCLNPKGHRHCGGCNKCAERKRAFHEAAVPDPTIYAR